ncbi:MAG: hypothetical protein ACT4P6_09650 [Gemmatimonadaceae bacterium]
MVWLPIRYREFYDVPRAFVVGHRGAQLYFLCAFDEESDEYPEVFRVYRLPDDAVASVEHESWMGLEEAGTFIGEVPVGRVRFDETRRAAIEESAVSQFLIDDPQV